MASLLIPFDGTSCLDYSYTALPTQPSIRLLKVERESLDLPDGSTQKVCSLITHKISEVPSYTALSYTWDGPVDTPASLEKYKEKRDWFLREGGSYRRLSVSLNLYNALLHLTVGENASTTIWTDAICINQGDLRERESQVSLMGQIYTRCKNTIVWLGLTEDFESDIPAFSNLHNVVVLAFHKYTQAKFGGRIIRIGNDWTAENFYQRLGLESYSGSLDWKGYWRFYEQCRWFQRAWVYQEVSFAPEVSFRCGFHDFDFLIIACLPVYLDAAELSMALFIKNIDAGNVGNIGIPWMRAKMLWDLRHRTQDIGSKSWQKSWAKSRHISTKYASLSFFLETIGLLRSANSKDERDRIFSALGYLQRSLPADSPLPFEADYQSDVQEMYTRTTATFLTAMPDLAILSHNEDKSLRRITGLPSWVPDFTVPFEPISYADTDNRFNATRISDDAHPGATVLVEGSRLRLKGVLLAHVSALLSSLGDIQFDGQNMETIVLANTTAIQSWFDVINSMEVSLTRAIYKRVTMLEVLWRTLTFNIGVRKGFKSHAQVSNQMFHDFLLGWIGKHYALKTQARYILERSVSLNEDYAKGPCWPSEKDLLNFRDWERMPKSEIDILLMTINREIPMEVSKKFQSQLPRIVTNTTAFSNILSSATTDRKIFATTEGFLGHGTASTKIGDQVWLIQGARMPFVLRQTDKPNCFTLVGESYVHGCMNGEVWGSRFKQPKTTEICLI